jgi:hypothetical protein
MVEFRGLSESRGDEGRELREWEREAYSEGADIVVVGLT